MQLKSPGAAAFNRANRNPGPPPTLADFRRLVAQVTPKRVECGNDKATFTTQPRGKALAGFTHYRSDTDTWRPVLALDLDDRDPFTEEIMAGQLLPFPSWLVYNTANGHAHALYALAEPVTQGPQGRRGPQNMAALAHDALALRLGADPGHRNTVTRTPWHRGHIFQPVLLKRWHLAELLALLPLEAEEAARRRKVERVTGTPLEEARGRNDHLYMTVIHWCMDEARAGRWAGLTLAAVQAAAAGFNTYSPPLPAGEVRTISRSAHGFMQASWWGNRSSTPGQGGRGSPRERLRSWQRDPITPQEARERQRQAALETAQRRTATTRAVILQAVENIRQSGQTPTSALLSAVTGLSVRTVKTHSDLYR